MFQWLTKRAVPKNRPGVPRARLGLEVLEGRECPSSPLHGAGILAPTGLLGNKAPVIQGFTATRGYNNTWTFAGRVVDETPSGLTVTFGGLPSLVGKTAVTNANGYFSLTIQLQPGESGTATAQTVDPQGLQSNVASTLVN